MSRSTLVLLLSLVAAGCSADGFEDGLDNDPANDTDTEGGDDTDAAVLYDGPTYWSVDGSLEVADGAVTAVESSVSATFYDQDAQPWRNEALQGPSCALGVLESAPGPTVEDESEALIGWWQLVLDPGTEEPCPWPIPIAEAAGDTEAPQLILGIGPLDPRLSTAMRAASLDPESPVYGLYALHPGSGGDRVFVFGVAGTQAQFDGTDSTVDAPPPADGTYALRTLLLLPIPEASRD